MTTAECQRIVQSAIRAGLVAFRPKVYRGLPIDKWRRNNRKHQQAWRDRQPKRRHSTHRPEPRWTRKYSKASGYRNHPSLKGLIGTEYHTAYMRLYRKRLARAEKGLFR
jgi:hypothetical protein